MCNIKTSLGPRFATARRLFGAALWCFIVVQGVPAANLEWIGGSNGLWHVDSNWSGGTVPTPEDNVTIDGDVAVTVSDARVLTGSFTLSGNALLQVDGMEAVFNANGPTTLENGRLAVLGGGEAQLPNLITYVWSHCAENALFYVQDSGSLLVLNGLRTIEVNSPDCTDLASTLLVAGGGQLELKSLERISAEHDQELILTLTTGGTVSLSALTEVDHLSILLTSDTALTLPLLRTATDSQITVNEGARLSAIRLASLTGCLVSLGGLDAFEVQLLTSMTGCQVFLNNTGRWSLSQLTELRDSYLTIGDGSVFFAPALESISFDGDYGVISMTGTGTLSAAQLTTLTNMAFVASGGSMVQLPSVTSLHWNHCEGVALFSTSGADTLLNFSGLRTLTIATSGCTGQAFSTTAIQGSQIDLSGLTQITAPTGQRVTFFAADNGTEIDVSALSNFDATIVSFLELNGGRILRSGSTGGEGEGEGEGESPQGCPAPTKARATTSATLLGDGLIAALLLSALGIRRKTRM